MVAGRLSAGVPCAVRGCQLYVRDTGLLHALLDVRDTRQLERHSKIGASWEGFVIDQIIQALEAAPHECYHWRTHAGAELDLLITRGTRRFGSEVTRTTTPSLTRSMKTAIADLRLKPLYVVHAGDATYPLSKQVQAVALGDLLKTLRALR